MKEARNSLLSTMLTFFINKGETFSLVGESGSGKTTIGRAIIGLNDTSNGEITFLTVRKSMDTYLTLRKTTLSVVFR
mgnify:CR=1 FL=1